MPYDPHKPSTKGRADAVGIGGFEIRDQMEPPPAPGLSGYVPRRCLTHERREA